jgi:hypothetical protein
MEEVQTDSQETEVDSQETVAEVDSQVPVAEVDSQVPVAQKVEPAELGKRMRSDPDDEEVDDATATDEQDQEEEESWTSDGKPPYIFWHVNSHGSMNDTKKTHKYEEKKTDMDVHAFSIAGNQNQCGWASIIIKEIPRNDTEPYECSGKAIDFCIPSVERIVWYDYKKRGAGDIYGTYKDYDAYNAAIKQVKNLYFHTETYKRIEANGGFKVMDKPTLYHEYQLYGNEGENTRPNSRKRLPKRTAAGDTKISDKMIYGVWVVCTNIRILEPLALTSITDEELLRLEENKGRGPNNLFLPPELMNPLNMASRRNRKPLGTHHWMKAIDILKKRDKTGDQELRKLRVRARTALENMWGTQRTNLHDIIDIFAPFNESGKGKGCKPIKLFSIDVSCRSNIGELKPPNPGDQPSLLPIVESYEFYDAQRKNVDVPAKKRHKSSSSSKSSSKKRGPPRPPWKRGGTKRKKSKYSRKRRAPPRTGNRLTRRRTRH